MIQLLQSSILHFESRRRTSRVFTIKQRADRVCFNCGVEFDFSPASFNSSGSLRALSLDDEHRELARVPA
jgi:hypothetical protein